jgi:secreted PhoX family phosphatase
MSIQLNNKFKLSALAISLLFALSGCNGDDGANGVDGTDGVAGVQGPAGQDGADGADGVDGVNGEDGADGADGANGADGIDGANGTDGVDGAIGNSTATPGLTRIATVPDGSEVTGIFVSDEGDLFFNVQHPSDTNVEVDSVNNIPVNTGTVGVLRGVNFNDLPKSIIDTPVPKTDLERQTVMSALGEYQILGQTGDTFEGGLAKGLGHIYTVDGQTLVLENDMPDFNGYVSTGAGKGYLFSNWEELPGGMSRMAIEKDSFGNWTVTDAMMVDFSPVWGTAANCFGSVSPWGTPLTSEEWVVDSSVESTTDSDWNDPAEIASNSRLGRMWDLVAPDTSNPYNYGYIVEITNPTTDTPLPVKHLAMGRKENENSVVMPDRKTVYISQDDTGGVLFKFIADTAEDLSTGTLYGAKLVQDEGSTEPATTGFDVTWVELASGNNSTIAAWIAEYDGIGSDDFVEGQTSYISMADVQAWADGAANYPTVENGGGPVTAGQPMDNRVAFLESRAAAKAKGATAEWRKLEGLSIHHDRALEAVEGTDVIGDEIVSEAYLYMGIADIDNTLTDDEGDIRLSARVKDCGGVYRAKLEASYDIARIEPVIMGGTYRSSLTGAERCDVNQLSQPDNVLVMKDGRVLIGEDGFQENNTLWMYDPKAD